MLGVQDEVAVDQLRGIGARLFAVSIHSRLAAWLSVGVGRHRLETGADARMRRDDHRHLRGQPHRPCAASPRANCRAVSGSKAASADAAVRSTSIGCAVFDRADDIEHRRRQLARRLELGVEVCELLLGRQFAVEQQPSGLLETRMFGEVVNRIAAIAQLAGLAVDERAGRTVEIDTREAAMNLDRFVCFGHC